MRTNVQLPISASATDILENPASSNMVIRADVLTVCNPTASSISVDVYLTRSSTTYAIAKTIAVPAYSSLVTVDKDYPVYLKEGDRLQVQASAVGLHAICAYTIISDATGSLPSGLYYLTNKSWDNPSAITTPTTFTNVGFGQEGPTRKIVVVAHVFSNSTGRVVSGITVGGVAAQQIVSSGAVSYASVDIFLADLPTGTSGDIVVSVSASYDSVGIGVYSLATGYPSAVSVDGTSGSGGGLSLSTTVNTASGGVVISGGTSANATVSWSGATEVYNTDIRTGDIAAGATINSTGSGQSTISATGVYAIASASWQL
jgi:hypothetical protein